MLKISNTKLRQLCIEKNWFTDGSISQYDKLFYSNSQGCSFEDLATIIWLCSDDDIFCRRDILEELKSNSIEVN